MRCDRIDTCGMQVKSRQEILRELVAKSKEYPEGWKALVRKDSRLFAQEYYISHPHAGIYTLKEYQVNPFVTSGIGAHISPYVPQQWDEVHREQAGAFGILEIDIAKLLEKVTKDDRAVIGRPLLDDDMGIRVTMHGPAHETHSSLSALGPSFASARRVVDQEFRKLMDRDGLTKSYL